MRFLSRKDGHLSSKEIIQNIYRKPMTGIHQEELLWLIFIMVK